MKRLLCSVSFLLCVPLVNGCVSSQQIAQSATAGRIGCSPAEIAIADHQINVLSKSRNWTAICKGKTYFCSGVSTGYGAYTDVQCSKK